MFFVYILQSGKQRYIGSTIDIQRRLKEHNTGQNHSTKAYASWKLIYYEAHTNKLDAERREKYFKTNSGKQALARMLRKYYEDNE